MDPQLDHLNGRAVQSVSVSDAENQWAITLEGEATIRNYDEEREPPTEIDGLVLLSSSEGDEATSLQFGYSGEGGVTVAQEISLTPGLYAVVVPGYTPAEEAPLPEDPSPDRVADGPEEPDESPQAEPESEK